MPSEITVAEKVSQMLNESPSVPRFELPSYSWWNERLHGVAWAGVETVFPQAIGLATSSDHRSLIDEIYGQSLSPETISTITDSVLERAKEWQNRPLQPVYPIIFLDALVIKLEQDRVVKNAVLYGVIAINMDGNKECLGLYLSKEPESSRYWLSVVNELKNRGVQDVLIFSDDNLTGISEAIESAFPLSDIQKCVVHQIRNSLKHVPWNERKTVVADLRNVYNASTEETALLCLEDFEGRWSQKYPYIAKSRRNNWTELSTFFKYSPELRKLIYTTNPIESFNRSLRKVSNNRPVFQTEDSVAKLYFLATMRLHEK